MKGADGLMEKATRGIALCLCVLLCLSGCSGSFSEDASRRDRQIKIGVCAYDQFDTFISTIVEAFKNAAKQKELDTGISINLEVVGAGGKQNVQNDQVADFIDREFDILCVNIVDRTDTTMIIDKAKSADVPVIFFNRELVREDLERWDKLYYVGAETIRSGIMQGEIVARLCSGEDGMALYDRNGDGKLQYVMLEGEAGHQDALIRTEYSVSAIIEEGIQVEKLGNEIANWSRAQAQTKMKLWLEKLGDRIELVLANNDDMALGALDALEEYGADPLPIVVGVDGTPEAKQAVEEGTMGGTVVNDAEGQAKAMLELACHLGLGTELPEDIVLADDTYIRLPHTIVMKENK